LNLGELLGEGFDHALYGGRCSRNSRGEKHIKLLLGYCCAVLVPMRVLALAAQGISHLIELCVGRRCCWPYRR
jgi:hypothetical protein